jgi:hypothetical protein
MSELRTSELDAVNWLLSLIGEGPVNNLEDTGLIDVASAQDDLRQLSRQIQMKGWHFNTEDEQELLLDSNGEISVGANWLSVRATARDGRDVVVRNGKLYDRRNQTSVFEKAVEVRLVYFLPWDDLPEYARNYIKALAGEKFQKSRVGSTALHQLSQEDVARARVDFLREDGSHRQVNFLYDNPSMVTKRDRSSEYAIIGNRYIR